MTDTLSEVLAVTRLKGTVYFSAELRAPWGVTLPRRSRSPFYAVTQGQCEITLDGARSPVSLGPGGLVVLPGGMGHTLASSSTVTASPLDQFVARYPMDDAGHLKVLDGSGPREVLGRGRAAALADGGLLGPRGAPRAAGHHPAAHHPPTRRRSRSRRMARPDTPVDRERGRPGAPRSRRRAEPPGRRALRASRPRVLAEDGRRRRDGAAELAERSDRSAHLPRPCADSRCSGAT